MAKKQVIRLTEGDLHRIVKESVNKVLMEDKNAFDKLASMKNYVDGQNNYETTDISVEQSEEGIYVSTSCRNEYGGNYSNNDEEFISWENVPNWLMKLIRKGNKYQSFTNN